MAKTHDTTIFTLSHSSMSIIEKCPREWFYRYVQRYYFNNPQAWTDFGLTWHEVSELYRGEGTPRLKELVKQVMNKRGYKIHPEYRSKMKVACKNLKNYYDVYLKGAKLVKFEKKFYTDLNEYIDLVGLIDILYQNEAGEWVVVDLKTSKQKGDHEEQLMLYYYLMYLITGKKPKRLRAQVVYLSLESHSTDLDDIVEEYVLEADDLNMIENRICSTMSKITNCGIEKEKYRKKPSALCNYCVYKQFGICDGEKPKNG